MDDRTFIVPLFIFIADINSGTFYLHYKDIYDMLDSIEAELIEQFKQIFGKYDTDDTKDFPYPLFFDIFRLIDENSELCKALVGPNGDISLIMKIREIFRHQCIEAWIWLHWSY